MYIKGIFMAGSVVKTLKFFEYFTQYQKQFYIIFENIGED